MVQYRRSLSAYRESLLKQLELIRVKYGMGVNEEIAYLQGYCPKEKIDQLKKDSESYGWGYIIEDPEDPAEVPTLIKTPKWIRMIQPVFNFLFLENVLQSSFRFVPYVN